MNIIETKNLTKHFGQVKALDGLNLSIKKGEIFGYIGPNGAGKSTTIRLLLDLIRPTSGSATIFGLDANKKSVEIHKNLGYLPGEIFLQDSMTGQECFDYYKSLKGDIDEKYTSDLIKRLELDLSKKIRNYSKGNKQKLAILLAFMHKPKLLLLDEPTSGLDPLNQQEFYNMILETKKWGTTTFLSTHILSEAERICDRVGIIKEGKLLKIENIDEFKDKNIRDVYLETDQTIPLSEFDIAGIKKVERTTSGYHLVTIGLNGKIIEKLSKNKINDIKISEPSLEDRFMHFYNHEDHDV